MRICHVTPHLPPDQAANALLPYHLGAWAREAGAEVCYLAHPPRAGEPRPQPGPVVWIPSRRDRPVAPLGARAASIARAIGILRRALPVVARADLVHVHGNGLLAETAALAAGLVRKPVVLTLYGTEVWHYAPRRVDLFTRAYRRAARVTFYSRRLLDRAVELGLDRAGLVAIYPPVPATFTWHDAAARARLRADFGLGAANLLVNVKRLHPLAGQPTLVRAMPLVLAAHPDTELVLCGTGPLQGELEHLARELGVSARIRFAGLVENAAVARYCAAADLFVLPSRLEACPTVAVEALAAGTPVVSTDNPGGLELHDLFGDDVEVVPRENPEALASAVIARLAAKRRTRAATAGVIEREFRPAVVWNRFRRIYDEARDEAPGRRSS
jgi:phosphatidylinositol alpha-1,6-mannosyltransferase